MVGDSGEVLEDYFLTDQTCLQVSGQETGQVPFHDGSYSYLVVVEVACFLSNSVFGLADLWDFGFVVQEKQDCFGLEVVVGRPFVGFDLTMEL